MPGSTRVVDTHERVANPDGDFLLEVTKGLAKGHAVVAFNGHNDTVGTSEETLWNEGGLVAFPSAAALLTVSSDSTDDDAGGTGALTVLISGLDANFVEAAPEIVTLSGQTAVTMTTSLLRVNTMVNLTAGSGGKNAGHIYVGSGSVTTGKPATVVDLIDTGNNITDSGFYTVPAAKSAYLVSAVFTGTGNKTAELSVYTRTDGALFLRIFEADLDNGPVVMNRVPPPRKIPAKTDIELRSLAGTSADVKAFVTLITVDD